MIALLLALQQPAAAATQNPSPVTRLVIAPEHPVVTAGDTLRLTAQAFGADGQPVSGAHIRWFRSGGRFEGTIDTTGLVRAGNDLVLVAELAAHRRLETTRRYSLPSRAARQKAVSDLEIDF